MNRERVKEILDEFEKHLMATYKSDGCYSSAVTQIFKGKTADRIIAEEGKVEKINGEYQCEHAKNNTLNAGCVWCNLTVAEKTIDILKSENEKLLAITQAQARKLGAEEGKDKQPKLPEKLDATLWKTIEGANEITNNTVYIAKLSYKINEILDYLKARELNPKS